MWNLMTNDSPQCKFLTLMTYFKHIETCTRKTTERCVYVFDEIQLIKGWELFVLRTYKNYCKHIFITGSTAEMLSEEMASALRGWPDEYVEYPLDFKEYLRFRGLNPNPYTEDGAAIIKSAFKHYCNEGATRKPSLRKRKAQGQRFSNPTSTQCYSEI